MEKIIDEILKYEQDSSVLEPKKEDRIEMIQKIINYTETFLESNPELPAFRSFHPDHLDDLNKPFLETPGDIDEIISDLGNSMDYSGINPASGKHLGYIPGGGIFTSSLADYWADITNRYAGVFYANPGAVKIENQIIRWLVELAGYGKNAWGSLLSGGSNANLSAIVTAREEKLKSLSDYENAVIYLTSQTHHCVNKAIKIAGLHHANIRYIKIDERYRMIPQNLKSQIEKDLSLGLKPFMIVGSVGTTDTGAIDPVNELLEIAHEYEAWFHIDAAYGGFFLLTDILDEFKPGINGSDSIVMDPHKSLFLPYGLGILLVNDGEALKRTFSLSANYLQDATEMEDEISPADVSPELTKHFRGLRMWLPLKLHGISPFKAALFEKHLLAKYFNEKVSQLSDFEVGPEPDLSVVLFRFNDPSIDSNKFNELLLRKIHEDGTIFVSSTTIDNTFWIRAAILVFRTHKNTIDLFLNLLGEFCSQIKNNYLQEENES